MSVAAVVGALGVLLNQVFIWPQVRRAITTVEGVAALTVLGGLLARTVRGSPSRGTRHQRRCCGRHRRCGRAAHEIDRRQVRPYRDGVTSEQRPTAVRAGRPVGDTATSLLSYCAHLCGQRAKHGEAGTDLMMDLLARLHCLDPEQMRVSAGSG